MVESIEFVEVVDFFGEAELFGVCRADCWLSDAEGGLIDEFEELVADFLGFGEIQGEIFEVVLPVGQFGGGCGFVLGQGNEAGQLEEMIGFGEIVFHFR